MFINIVASVIASAAYLLFPRRSNLFIGLYVEITSAPAGGIYITFGFLLAAIAPKTVQKFAENQLEKFKG